MVLGIDPVRLLCEKSNSMRELQFPICAGMRPVSKFLPIRRSRSATAPPISGGTLPSSRLALTSSTSSSLIPPMPAGSCPEMEFEARFRDCKPAKAVICGGISPDNALLDRSSTRSAIAASSGTLTHPYSLLPATETRCNGRPNTHQGSSPESALRLRSTSTRFLQFAMV
uniref:Uncharacterized protein n=1 Tax=Arundo donax TaxID=35708 RepID=A0A0A9CF44_ARUDO